MVYKRAFNKLVLITIVIFSFSSCIINDNIKDTSARIDPGNDPNFNIVVNTDGGYELFNRKVVVFNIPIYAFTTVEDSKLLHVANVLAQYLDNDEDGIVDNLIVHDQLKANNAFLFLWKTESERDSFSPPAGHNGSNISADDVNSIWHSNGHTGDFDNSLEILWKFLSSVGFESTYPNVFSSQVTSEIAIAMSKTHKTTLYYCFEKKGVLMDVNDDKSVVTHIDSETYKNLIEDNKDSLLRPSILFIDLNGFKQINDANHSVASATDEQNQVVKLLDTDIQTINSLCIQGKANLNDTLDECTKLKQQFSALENMVQKFKV